MYLSDSFLSKDQKIDYHAIDFHIWPIDAAQVTQRVNTSPIAVCTGFNLKFKKN